MSRKAFLTSAALLAIIRISALLVAQDTKTKPSQTRQASSEPTAPFKAASRMVTLEVVVKDRKGNQVRGLKAEDFQVFEQSPSRGKQKHEQKVAVFREVRMADFASQAAQQVEVPAGVHTNLVTLQKDPVPPTILLVDGLNTELVHQAQVHIQMVRMLKSLPSNVPVAVFLLGHRLHMLQDLTSDPKLLRAALEQATTAAGAKIARIDPRDDPDELSAVLEKIGSDGGSGAGAASAPRFSAELLAEIKYFEQRVYAGLMDVRVQQTIDALTSLAHHVAGYPGRKNLLWISTSFPVYLRPLDFMKPEMSGGRNYWAQTRNLAAVLSAAKISVYPINPAGVQSPELYKSATRPRDISPAAASDTLARETLMYENEQDTMEAVAEGTGGRVCTGDNDLSECIGKAVDDSSSFYELAYYPDSANWNGEYRNIILKSKQSGLRLAYRRAYYATLEGTKSPKDQQAELRQAACEDYMNATSIFMAAKPLPSDSPDKLKFYLMVNPSALTLEPGSDGPRELKVTVAACTFDKRGWPVQLVSEAIQHELDEKQYQSLITNGWAHVVEVPTAKTSAVRLLVKDFPSGRIGSVNIKVDDSTTGAPVGVSVHNH